MAQADGGAARALIEMLETGKQRGDLGAAPMRRIADVIRLGRLRQHRCLLRRCGSRKAGRRCAHGECLNQTAAAHAGFALPGLTMLGHVSLSVIINKAVALATKLLAW